MRIGVDVSAGGIRLPMTRAVVAQAAREVLRAERVRDALLSIAFVSRRAIARLNRAHLGHSGPTDVIAFGLRDGRRSRCVVGDVYISPEVARNSARRHGVTIREELLRLVVHGVLHTLGDEHPDGESRTDSPMWRKQERLLARITGSPA